jgi:hypothetical protein
MRGVVLLSTLAGCVSYPSIVRERFENEHDCDDVEVDELGGNAFRAQGCGLEETYVCATDTHRSLGGAGAPVNESFCVRDSSSGPAARPSAPPGPRYDWPPASGRVRERFDEFQQRTVVTMDMTIRDLALRIAGSPSVATGVLLLQIDAPGGWSRYDCGELLVLVDGNLHRFAAARHTTDGQGLASSRFELPLEDLHSVAAGQEVKGRFCVTDWQFVSSQLDSIREFLARFRAASAQTPPASRAPAGADAGVAAVPDAGPPT